MIDTGTQVESKVHSITFASALIATFDNQHHHITIRHAPHYPQFQHNNNNINRSQNNKCDLPLRDGGKIKFAKLEGGTLLITRTNHTSCKKEGQ